MTMYGCFIVMMMTACTMETADTNRGEYNIKKEGPWTSMNGEIFISTESPYDTNLILVTSGKEATLIDTGNGQEGSSRVKEYIEKNGLVLKNIILTHMDKGKNIKMFKAEDTAIISPMGAQHNQTIQMGDKLFKILAAPGDSHMSIELNETILFPGDLMTAREDMPVIRTNKNLPAKIKAVEDLKTKNYALIIPAHGPSIEKTSFIAEYLDKLKALTLGIEMKEEANLNIVNKDIIVSTGSYEKVNMILVVSGEEATLIDTGNDKKEALAIQSYIQNNHLKLKNIIITHEHADHINNLDMFLEEGVKLYKYSDLQSNDYVMTMGDKTFKIRATPGHFNDQHMSVELNDTILIAGDIIATNIRPGKLLQFGGTRDTLVKTLEELNKNNYTLIIPGHGDICIGKDIIQEHLDSLKFSE